MIKILSSILFVALLLLASPSTAEIITKEVSFRNGEVQIFASLLMSQDKKGKAGRPAVIMVHGSGDGPREIFLPMARWYAEQGFIVLIYDKRGSGRSGGNWQSSSLTDLAEDVVAGLSFLAGQPVVARSKIGIFGVSQAGWVLPVAVTKSEIATWAIVVTGGGVRPDKAEIFATRQQLEHAGFSSESLEQAEEVLLHYYNYLGTGQGMAELDRAIEKFGSRPWFSLLNLRRSLLEEDDFTENWGWVGNYDPVPFIGRSKLAWLVMLAAEDTQSNTRDAVLGWQTGFDLASNPASVLKVFPDVGHGLVVGGHDMVAHSEAREFAPGYYKTQAEWLRELGIMESK